MASFADVCIGQILSERYWLTEHIRDAHFSHVFKAKDQQTGMLVAVKMLALNATRNPSAVLEFKEEGAVP